MQNRDLEDLSLAELMPYWTNMLWWIGIRPIFNRLLETDLTLSECIVLKNLQRGTLSVAEVADCVHITHSAASRAVDRLVREGFVSRQEDPEDRRQKQLTLTPAGEALNSGFHEVVAVGAGQLLEALSETEQEQLRHLLARMITAQLATQQADNGSSECVLGGSLEQTAASASD